MLPALIKNLSNIPGWRTGQKIIVLESDDWGSIRMSSAEAVKSLHTAGIDVLSGNAARYNQNDTLASAEDLEALYQVLQLFKDSNNNHPVFTALSLVANPDFEKIKAAGFREYFYEPFTKTLERYNRKNAFELWQQGIKTNLFIPQFHGREHLNVAVWMRALQQQDPHTLAAFEKAVWGFKNTNANRINYQAAFDLEFPEDIAAQKKIIADGLALFEQLHGYKASFFVPPNGPINNALEETAALHGIRYMSASKIQQEALGNGNTKKVYHYLGQQNKFKQIYITRNCFFEPCTESKDWVASCLSDINTAFRWHKPAVISSHRVNYVGSLNEANRKKGLHQLKALFTEIRRKWPEAIFLSSNQLGDIIKAAKKL